VKEMKITEIISRLEMCNASLERSAYLADGATLDDVDRNTIESTGSSTQNLIEVHRNNEMIQELKKQKEDF